MIEIYDDTTIQNPSASIESTHTFWRIIQSRFCLWFPFYNKQDFATWGNLAQEQPHTNTYQHYRIKKWA